MFAILSSRVHIFSQIACLLAGVLIVTQTGMGGYVSAEWVVLQIHTQLPAWLVIFLNPIILFVIAFCLDIVVGSDNGTASYEGTFALMHLAFCIAAAGIMICQYMILTGI